VGLSLTIHIAFIPITPTDWDEYVYDSATRGEIETGTPSLRVNPGEEVKPFQYQPVFHFKLAALYMFLRGSDTIQTARELSALIAALTVAAIMYATRMMTQSRVASLLAGVFLATDGWFTYTSGLFKLDTACVLIGIIGLVLYDQAIKTEDKKRANYAAVLLGFASIYKQVGTFVLIAVVLNWLSVWKLHRMHRRILAIAGSILVIFVIANALSYGQSYIDATYVQFKRATGIQQARGLNIDANTALLALAQTYYVFGGTLLVIGFALVTWVFEAAQRIIDMCLGRPKSSTVVPVLITNYMWGANILLGMLRLHNPHYLVLSIVPSTMRISIIVRNWVARSPILRAIAYGLVASILLFNVATLVIRATYFTGKDAFAQASVAIAHLPSDASIVSEQPICQEALATQTCTQLDLYSSMKSAIPPVKYIITVESVSQHPPLSASVLELIANSTEITRFGNWNNGWIIVREVNDS
jgi:4-amino-4-deoxy-L-arabinose transferase-like glycosyltransferase